MPCPTYYPTFVRKTSVYLSEAQAERLARLSEQQGRPQAQIIRDAIAAYAAAARSGDRRFSVDGVVEGDGTSVADVGDDDLLQGFGV